LRIGPKHADTIRQDQGNGKLFDPFFRFFAALAAFLASVILEAAVRDVLQVVYRSGHRLSCAGVTLRDIRKTAAKG